jgi:Gluconate 2-dehydrogenase subunit 3
MKRRRFVQSLLVTPAAAPIAATAAQETKPLQQSSSPPNTPARETPRQPQSVPKLELLEVDLAANTQPHYFTTQQFATLEKLGIVMVPPLKGNPGALDAHAPEFLDFLISVSPPDRQTLYRSGLDGLNSQAQSKFNKPFSELDSSQVGAILRPLLTVRPWPRDLPSDPLQNFVAQVHEDLRTATMNSREWASATAKSGHRFTRGFHGTGLYWAPIDPVIEA